MPTPITASLTEDRIDDLLYLARIGETSDLATAISELAKSLASTASTVYLAATDPHSGNGLLHMACANGHTETLTKVLSLILTETPTSRPPTPNPVLSPQNASGNTPLHWACLNGHLETVKTLVDAGADVTVTNNAGHDAVYEAEVNNKPEVSEWLLTAVKELEQTTISIRDEEEGSGNTSRGGKHLEESMQGASIEAEEEANTKTSAA